ncbi:CCA tRNA nucleotidyltransferase [Methanolobus halotolerans]|uniref:CCA-adding enzyme n=1 Tax=Methanolobus halotolerans TaxID=2052935 RepID=A0A4E0QQY2_9EURY|nr:CCA tRNA nucleotidyltransferase [Methanolobus halotolerans]TGC08452.1 CCA tRNA nucleotidyltransferase [Methanolobus halotolerans]
MDRTMINEKNPGSAIEQRVLKKIKPSAQEKKRLCLTVDELLEKADIAAGKLGVATRAMLVGSAARGTWISGTHDLDIFISFPEETSREELESSGLLIARELAKEAETYEERYAEHPYLNMRYRGFDVDVVPCFAVSSASNIKSAVDRTPFHNRFVKEHINNLQDDVMILKQFMKGTGVYGSELRTQGFSGYLTELLVIHYGSFKKVVFNACEWKPGMVIDLAGHGSVDHKESLVVVDPTDPRRNVAAALSIDRFAQFIEACRSYLDGPSLRFFFPEPQEPLDDREIHILIQERESSFLAIVFDTPDVVEDVLYPQLDKMQTNIRALLEQYEFTVLNSGTWANGRSIVLVELISSTLPRVKKHQGPPVWVRSHAQSFRSKYEGSNETFSLYIENGNYVADIRRKFPTAKKLIEERLTTCSMGKHLTDAVEKGYMILENEQLCDIKDDSFRVFMRKWINCVDTGSFR